MTNTPSSTPVEPTQASAPAPLHSPTPAPKVKEKPKLPRTVSGEVKGPKHLFPNPIKVFSHDSDRTFRESPHFENTPHYTMENEADQNARSELKLPRIHTDNSGNIHVVSSTGEHLGFPELKKVLEQHLLKQKFKDNPYSQNKRPLESHKMAVNKVVSQLNKVYGTTLEHDTKSHQVLSEKLHALGKKLSSEGRSYKEIAKAQGDAIHQDYIEGLFGAHGLNEAKSIKVTNKDGTTTPISAEKLKAILLTGKQQNGKKYPHDLQKLRKTIIHSLQRNRSSAHKLYEEFADGSRLAGKEFLGDLGKVGKAITYPVRAARKLFGSKNK